MKSIKVLEVSNDKKVWIRLSVMYNFKIINNFMFSIKEFKYRRFRRINVHNATKIENLL